MWAAGVRTAPGQGRASLISETSVRRYGRLVDEDGKATGRSGQEQVLVADACEEEQ